MEGNVHASCRRMRRATGVKLAQIIVDINHRLRAWDRQQREVKDVGQKPFSYDDLIPEHELQEETPNPPLQRTPDSPSAVGVAGRSGLRGAAVAFDGRR